MTACPWPVFSSLACSAARRGSSPSVYRSLAEKTAAGCYGSGHAGRLPRFTAEKRPLKLRFAEAAGRH